MVRCDTDEVVLRSLLEQTELVRSLVQQGAAKLDRAEEPDVDQEVERTTPLEDEPPHSAEEVHEQEEVTPSWQLRR